MKIDFLSFVRKETLHIFRDKRTMLIVLLMPVVLMILFGFAISTEVNNIKVAVVAPHHTESIRQAVDKLSHSAYFSFKGYITEAEIDHALRSGDVSAVVVFAPDYDRRMEQIANGIPTTPAIQLILDAADTNTATSAAMYLQNTLLGEKAQQSLFDTHMLYNPQMKSSYNFVPGIMGLIFILICAMMTSVSIVREKETGTMEVLLVSPIRPIYIILAKMIPYFLLSCINLITILLIAHYLLEVPMSGSMGGLIGISLLYLVLSLALGLLISTLADRQASALLISAMVMLMPIVMLSGMIFPIENLPDILQAFSCIVPARWYTAAIRKLMIEGVPFIAVIKEFCILVVMTLFLIAVSLKKFNDKLE